MQNGDGADGKILTTLGGGNAGSEDEAKVHRCRGSTTSLSAGEATVAKSHASYGRDPYPANYLCRWLFLPVGGCQIGLQCREGTTNRCLVSYIRHIHVGPVSLPCLLVEGGTASRIPSATKSDRARLCKERKLFKA